MTQPSDSMSSNELQQPGGSPQPIDSVRAAPAPQASTVQPLATETNCAIPGVMTTEARENLVRIEATNSAADDSVNRAAEPSGFSTEPDASQGDTEPSPVESIGPQAEESEAFEVQPEPEEVQSETVSESSGSPAVRPIEEVPVSPPEIPEFQWYIIRVMVNRETVAAEALRKRIQIAGLQDYFGEIVAPTEDVVEFTKTGKKRTVKRKLFPGYIMVRMALTDETWFLVRETPGIGDFTGGAGRPTPMTPDEVRRIIRPKGPADQEEPAVRLAIPFSVGDRVRVKEGYFQNFEGDVAAIDETNGRVTVMINIFGRSTPVELQHWQMERI